MKTKDFEGFVPRLSCHPVRCVYAVHPKLTDTVNVEVPIVEKTHFIIRYSSDSVKTLEMRFFVPLLNADVIEACRQRRPIVHDEPLHALPGKARFVCTRGHRGLDNVLFLACVVLAHLLLLFLFPSVDITQGMGGSLENRNGCSETVRHYHTLSIRRGFLWQLRLYGSGIIAVFPFSRLFDPVLQLLEIAQHRRSLDLIHFGTPNAKVFRPQPEKAGK